MSRGTATGLTIRSFDVPPPMPTEPYIEGDEDDWDDDE